MYVYDRRGGRRPMGLGASDIYLRAGWASRDGWFYCLGAWDG
jgi:hypothetical protein